jgi:hypothetical protein
MTDSDKQLEAVKILVRVEKLIIDVDEAAFAVEKPTVYQVLSVLIGMVIEPDPDIQLDVPLLSAAWEYWRWLFEIEWLSKDWAEGTGEEPPWYDMEVGSDEWYRAFAAARTRFWSVFSGGPRAVPPNKEEQTNDE